jgi:hypothetical protein
LLVTAAAWLVPPPVLPLPSRSGAEGPPRPFGGQPAPGPTAPPTDRGFAQAQDRALLNGPFPRTGLTRGVSDGTLLLSEVAQVRNLALSRIRATGASVVRIPVNWRNRVDPDPPTGFDARDPASASYHFAILDAAVSSAVAAGLTPLLVVSHAPEFAEAPDRWDYAYPGSWAPSPAALEAFAVALARRYDGSYPDPAHPGALLPRVRLFQAWNEPNLARYLEPQWVVEHGHWSAFSPLLYRQMLNGFYAGIKSVTPASVVVAAGVAPNGDPEGVGRMAPVAFLKSMLCLGDDRRCTEPPHFDVLAFHPLSVGNPDSPAASSRDVSISDAAKVTGLLSQAERLHTVRPAGVKPVWVTELNWESAPQAHDGVPASRQAQWISRALHRLWVAGVSLVDWQFLIDPYPSLGLSDPTGGLVSVSRPAGLYSAGVGGDPASAQPKAFLRGFSLPFDPLRANRRRVRLWALLRGPRAPVLLQSLEGKRGWRTIARLRADRHDVLNREIRLAGSVRLRLLSGSFTSSSVLLPRGPSLR